MTGANDTCAMCERFSTMKNSEQAAGQGWCTAWEKFVPPNGQIGVLFVRAKYPTPQQFNPERRLAYKQKPQRGSV
jgi:hypothetical protein